MTDRPRILGCERGSRGAMLVLLRKRVEIVAEVDDLSARHREDFV